MLTVLLVVQIFIAIALVGVVLIQRNASDGLSGLSGGSGSGDSLISGRASANFLTRITAVLALAFMLNSLTMAAITARSSDSDSVIETLQSEELPSSMPKTLPKETSEAPVEKTTDNNEPSVPIAE